MANARATITQPIYFMSSPETARKPNRLASIKVTIPNDCDHKKASRGVKQALRRSGLKGYVKKYREGVIITIKTNVRVRDSRLDSLANAACSAVDSNKVSDKTTRRRFK